MAAEVYASAVVMVTMLDTPCSRGGVKGTVCPHHSAVSPSLPLPCVTVCHHVSTGLYLKTGKDGFLPHDFQLVIYKTSEYLTPYNLS